MMEIKYPAIYTKPMTQVVLVGMTCAVSNLGAGGTQDVVLSDTSQGVLYGMFALTGLVSGGICNVLGPKLTLFIGTLGYALYVGALWWYAYRLSSYRNRSSNNSPNGAILGITAALLWSAQGSVMMSYPLEKERGRRFGILGDVPIWFLHRLCNRTGHQHSSRRSHSGRDVHLHSVHHHRFCGNRVCLPCLAPNKVIRADGTIVKVVAASAPHEEIIGMWNLLKDWRMLALLPMFFASNYFYAYQGAVTAARFDGPTRALNGTLAGAGAIIGALLMGYLVTFTRKDDIPANFINYKDKAYRGKGALYFFYFFVDACYQALAYWIMGALTNDPFKLARYAGLYKAIQSAGGAGSFGMDAVATPLLNEHLASWILMLVSFPFAWLVLRTVKETNYEDEKAVYVDDIKDELERDGEQASIKSTSVGANAHVEAAPHVQPEA
ncbi:hypothetical protein A0H81_02718 [Grifola frondosa]|uniref:UNC93-like protein 2 n=1 Tax=Grifola frondosa TaxID=5627 RepID=A0A1C7MMT8_GRIFR|nr:hypothetical protein A0H81_02718 [Grifola frondosa]